MGLDDNNFIAALPPEDRRLLEAVADIVELKTGKVIHDPGDIVRAAYFPLGSTVASYLIVMDTGSVIETAMVGREGAVGGIVSRGKLAAYARCCTMHGGAFARISSGDLEDAKSRSPTLSHAFSRYADCLLAQIFQSVACNATHTVDTRAAKWLVASVERTGRNEIVMTQDQLASMLGVGRSYASRQIQRFKAEGLVKTRRGGIVVLDYEGLRRRACGCNDQVRAHFDEVLAGVYPDIVPG